MNPATLRPLGRALSISRASGALLGHGQVSSVALENWHNWKKKKKKKFNKLQSKKFSRRHTHSGPFEISSLPEKTCMEWSRPLLWKGTGESFSFPYLSFFLSFFLSSSFLSFLLHSFFSASLSKNVQLEYPSRSGLSFSLSLSLSFLNSSLSFSLSTCKFRWTDKPKNVLVISKIGDAAIDKVALDISV